MHIPHTTERAFPDHCQVPYGACTIDQEYGEIWYGLQELLVEEKHNQHRDLPSNFYSHFSKKNHTLRSTICRMHGQLSALLAGFFVHEAYIPEFLNQLPTS